MTANVQKTAADQAAENYWSDYFKEYGQMWVRDIPRRVKSAMRRKLKASALDGHISILAHEIADDQSLSIEASFVGKIDDQNAKALATIVFDKDAKMLKFEATRIC